MKGQTHGTGDVNFAAAAMAVGIPLDDEQVIAVKRDNGHDYVRFFLGPVSIDGRVTIADVNRAWTHPGACDGRPHLEGFRLVMDFLRERPEGIRTSRDWFDYAHAYLAAQGRPARFSWPRRLEDVGAFVERHPHDMEGHVFAFLINRDVCIHLAKLAAEDPRLMFSTGKHAAGMLRERAPKWRRDQFLKMIG